MPSPPVARVFVSSDVLCLVIQGAAGALLSSQNATSQKLGRNIILAGLALQLVFYAVFAVVTHQLRARPEFNLHRIKSIRGLYIELYATIGLLFIRNLYRVVDFADTLHPTSYRAPPSRSRVLFHAFLFSRAASFQWRATSGSSTYLRRRRCCCACASTPFGTWGACCPRPKSSPSCWRPMKLCPHKSWPSWCEETVDGAVADSNDEKAVAIIYAIAMR